MSDAGEKYNYHPLTFDYRHDGRNRRQYFIDGCNRTTIWDEGKPTPFRSLFQHNQRYSPTHFYSSDMNGMQHGSIELRGCNAIYPSYSSYPPPPQPAFQAFQIKHNSILQKEMMSYNCRPSPVLSKTIGMVMGANAFQHKSHNMETSMSVNTDELVMKIGATFPTVSETHIRCLLKKYHNREAVVMSALQVEKYPIATPGPQSTFPLARNLSIPGSVTSFQMTPPVSIRGTPSTSIRRNMVTPPVGMCGSVGTPPLGVWGTPPTRGSSPVLRPGSNSSYYSSPAFGEFRNSPKSQSSPKMKLRYLKSIFPKVEETLLLDTLASENNNVMKTTEKLKMLGFEKRDSGKWKIMEKKQKDELSIASSAKSVIQREVEIQKPTPPPRMKSLEEKNRMKERLGGLYEDIPERLIQIAIESVNYDEEKARQLLNLMINEEKENKADEIDGRNENGDVSPGKPGQKEGASRETQKSSKSDDKKKETNEKKAKMKRDVPKVSRGTSTTEDKEFKSKYLSKVFGRNKDLRVGPNDQLLLSDYMTWHGPNPELKSGPDQSLVEGPNKNLLHGKPSLAKGADKENWKGAKLGLAKGSIYSHITMILKG